MLWNLCHKLFGWDYIYWENGVDQGVARVYIDAENRPYYWRYKATKLSDRINTKEQVMWLTCLPSKYFEEINNDISKTSS